ncbi:glycosyltransferase family 2 protein [Cyanobium sp. CH-040]|uniref:glycosyltransferase family 2 protein n=1 Tax=Cyanobium sp. CH-040 TaxID=2823708 RepID=UPI0020CEBB16|nr:glycosyltransferase family 2 protein [Cyanobium sp. CH-040]MCP9927188.1 glycosyltransferase family 2 protein [Cyanobium sp. CH-040]
MAAAAGEAHRRERTAILILVAFHPAAHEVARLQACLDQLAEGIGYAVVVNDHHPGEAVDALRDRADCFLANRQNPGYGCAVNQAIRYLSTKGSLPRYAAALNTDLSWQPGTIERLFDWLQRHPEVSLAVPRIVNEEGILQHLCKRDPTVLAMLSRRFLPDWVKPRELRRYDAWYVMADHDYDTVFDVPYLSGCCMLMRSDAFLKVGGFDERFFLYLEDADLTRRMAREGCCVHLPVAEVVHGWGRGNYSSLRLMLVNLLSAWRYFRVWGLKVW